MVAEKAHPLPGVFQESLGSMGEETADTTKNLLIWTKGNSKLHIQGTDLGYCNS